MAARALVSAISLAGVGVAVKNATALLNSFCAAGIAIEVTHRSKRRLYGLAGLAPCAMGWRHCGGRSRGGAGGGRHSPRPRDDTSAGS